MRDPSRRRRAVGLVAAIAAVLALPAAASAAVDETLLVSRANGPNGAGGASSSTDASISDNGCRIAFSTTSNNLAGTDPAAGQNTILRDVCAGTTVPVAIDQFGGPANGFNSTATISGDGCRVAFWTTASLVPPDADGLGSVYVRDVCSGNTLLVSEDFNGDSVEVSQQQAAISADGSLVAFSTHVHVETDNGINDQNPGPGNPRDVYLRNLGTGEMSLVSVDAAGNVGANGDSTMQAEGRNAISDDGRFISLLTASSNMFPAGVDTNGAPDIYVRDRVAGAYERATLSDADQQLTGATTATAWAISGNGRRVAFTSASPQLGGNGQLQVWLRDLNADTTELISRFSGPEGDISTSSGRPALDDAGRLVAFASSSPNLATKVTGAQIFVRDTLNQTTHAISRKSGHLGALSAGPTPPQDVAFNDDGHFAAIVSSSPGLGAGDANGGQDDVFRRELNEPGSPSTRVAFNARPIVAGAKVNTPGKGRARPLGTINQLPIGTVVDATKGRIAATTTGNTQSKPVQTAEFYGARFVVTQRKNTLALMKVKGTGGACGKGGKGGKKGRSRLLAAGPLARAAGARRGLWGSGKGRFGTRGKRGAGTVRGTKWFVQNRCDGSTFFRVKQGVVAVDDFGLKGRVDKVLKKGDTYVARAKGRR